MKIKRRVSLSRTIKYTILVTLAGMGTGCTLPLSQHPLSDEITSELDERLIGHWRRVDPLERADPNLPRFVVGRVAETEHTLEVVFPTVAEDGTAKINRQQLFSTKLAGHRYLSIGVTTVDHVPRFLICRYKLIEHAADNDQDDELHLVAMSPDILARAISEKKLPGKVTWYESPDKPDAKAQWVCTTAATAQLTEYLKKHERELFGNSRPLVFKKGRPAWR